MMNILILVCAAAVAMICLKFIDHLVKEKRVAQAIAKKK